MNLNNNYTKIILETKRKDKSIILYEKGTPKAITTEELLSLLTIDGKTIKEHFDSQNERINKLIDFIEKGGAKNV